MKLTKTEFKAMIKDCIKDLIKEGAFNQIMKESGLSGHAQPLLKSAPKNPMQTQIARQKAREMAGYDDFAMGGDPSEIQHSSNNEYNSAPLSKNLQNLVENTALAMSKGDSNKANVYAEVFADTAMNTLPKMLLNDPNRSGYGNLAAAGMHAQKEVVPAESLKTLAGPEGDVTKWAQIAFGKV